MELKFYAPVDCDIVNIDKCSDPTFSQKLLGDGFLIKPKKGDFSLPFDKAKAVMIFDTKHAYGFDIDGLGILLHCGLETVSLKGKPFITTLKTNQNIMKGEKLFDVDLKILREKNISSETPIVFDKKIEIKNFKEGTYKKGDLVCSIEFIEEKKEIVIETIEDFFNAKNKYEKVAFEINKLVGSKENYKEVYNCMTRLRFTIIDKTKVDESALLKVNLVKQLIWNGNELQVVIGQEVFKVKDEIVNQNEFIKSVVNTKEKKSIGSMFFQMIAGTMIRTIPIMTGTGMIQAIIAILVLLEIMPNIVTSLNPMSGSVSLFDPNLNVGWAVLFIIGRSAGFFMGIAIAYTAAEYFKLNPVLGVGLGIIMCSPIFFLDGGQNGIGYEKIWWDLGNLTTPNIPFNGITKIFRIIPLGTKTFTIIPIIYVAKKVDEWVRKWMPIALDLLFRPLIVFLIPALFGFFLVTPGWNIIEALLGGIFFYILKAPLGIGVGIATALWQICVIFGVHGPLSILGQIEYIGNRGWGYLYVSMHISTWALIGALIAVAIVSKNSNLKKQAWGMVPMGFLGITEPILYGIMLPKRRALYAAVITSFVIGALMNTLNVSGRLGTGTGIFATLGYFAVPPFGGTAPLDPLTNGLLFIMGSVIAIIMGLCLTILIYKERISEKTLINKTTKKLINKLNKDKNIEKSITKEIETHLKKLNKIYSEKELKFLKEQEKQIQSYLKMKTKINNKIEKNEYKIEKLFKKGKKAIKNQNQNEALAIKDQIDKLSKLDLSAEEENKNLQRKNIDFEGISKLKIEKQKQIEEFLKYIEEKQITDVTEFKDSYFEGTNSLLKNYGM
ncbi:hypothetical protein mflW37_0080 [Mesoplasma florum W37]|uniref:PTS system, glucose-specific IIA component n=1 Tax=Mesoplasma florum TaxID=2151 RepID=A0AAD0HRX6_MESFO|nr:PTS glucose transporter subunit IIABC [Mesoplasma florum]AGY41075.1 hypothetical protein mflW37_0080 [Mesoplasma florum W37]AVN59309.1 hypothetical protein CG008_00040 [Mesoplasma florum]AVN65413.1 PTS system, glucose-specific IIA component [Mesoplasma florum]